jgi:hypothetical protein
VTWTNYLTSAGGLVGMHGENVGGSTLTRYFNKDHLGSVGQPRLLHRSTIHLATIGNETCSKWFTGQLRWPSC